MNKPAIMIDPGHGGKDPGASIRLQDDQPKLTEAELVFAYSLDLQTELESLGFIAYLTRQSLSEDVSLQDRVYGSRVVRPAAFISLHVNAATPPANGFEVFFSPNNFGGKDFAQAVYQCVDEQLDIKMRGGGAKTEKSSNHNTLYVLHNNPRPSALVELAFLTNHKDRKRLLDSTWKAAMVFTLAKAVSQHVMPPV